MGEGGGGEAPCGGSYSYRPPRCNGYGHAGTYIHTDIKINTSTYFVRGTGGPQDAQVVILAPVAMRMRVAFTHAISSAAVGGAARGWGGAGRGGAGRSDSRHFPDEGLSGEGGGSPEARRPSRHQACQGQRLLPDAGGCLLVQPKWKERWSHDPNLRQVPASGPAVDKGIWLWPLAKPSHTSASKAAKGNTMTKEGKRAYLWAFSASSAQRDTKPCLQAGTLG